MRTTSLALAATATLAGHALAASSTSTPTVSLFLPMGSASNIAASVITAAPSSTVYAIGCLQPSDACSSCAFSSSFTITEGVSTLKYTWTDGDRGVLAATGSSLTQDVTTVNCNLFGGTAATQAICTGNSAVAGIGNGTQTTTLASSQIVYAPVTITAGAANMKATGYAGSGASGTSGGSGAAASASSTGAATAVKAVRYGAAAIAAGVGAVAML